MKILLFTFVPPPRWNRSFHTKKAFTLIELLIASSLLVVIILALYTGFHVGITTGNTSQEVSDELQELRIFFDTFEQDLRNCVIYDDSNPNNLNSGFNGEETKLGFLSRGSRFIFIDDKSVEIDEIRAVSYIYDEDNQAVFRDTFQFSDFLSNGFSVPDAAKNESNRVARKIKEFRISYISVSSTLIPQPIEEDSWPSDKGIPAKVKVRLVFARGNRETEFTRTIHLPLKIKIQ